MKRPVRQGERGAALLAVLALVAVMGALAAGAFETLRLSTALAANGAAADQARAYAHAVETLLTLKVDQLAGDRQVTTLAGNWNGATRQIPLPGGSGLAEGTVTDGGNCFNVNSVVDLEPGGRFRARMAGMLRFEGLMVALGIDRARAQQIAAAATDWADSDSEPVPGGAEDGVYMAAERPYRPGNTLLAEASELRALAGMTPEIYGWIRPWVCALPTTDLSRINLNTLLAHQAPLLTLVAPGALTSEQAQALIARRPAGGWRELSEVGPVISQNLLEQVQLRTDWYALDLRVEHQGAEVIETALLDARLAPARIAVRRWTEEE